MKDLRTIVRRLKGRISIEDIYMYTFEYLYYEIFLGERINYYNFLNLVNIDKLIPVFYHHYFIDRDNVDSFCSNLLDKIIKDFIFIRCDENEAYDESNVVLLNRYYVKQSMKFNALVKLNPEYNNLIYDITIGLEGYIINTNFIYSILHTDSILYSFVDRYSYNEVIVQMQDYVIGNGIAVSLDSYLTGGYFKDNGIIRQYESQELFSIRFESGSEISDNTMLVYEAFMGEWDALNIYNSTQLTDTYIDDFNVGEGYRVYGDNC
ncbi:MAG: hypothetical protein PHR83_01945 [Paludibacter sp.]|nr:hypothetical protein [Paludibacter sp.]